MVIPCDDLDRALGFLTTELGFRTDAVFQADDPSIAILSGHKDQLCLVRRNSGISTVDSLAELFIPPLQSSFVLNKPGDDGWHAGRVKEMLYRDLIPDRQGGRFIASHIRILNGGTVNDPVHFHRVRFQMIYCYKGWVRLAYEDQGDEFMMNAGDCVLQPPEIRHQVKESSPNLEVIEICCPAAHWTFYDHDLRLPTPKFMPDRKFAGQRFMFHQVATAVWQPWHSEGFEAREIAIRPSTDGLAAAIVVRAVGMALPRLCRHNAEFYFMFVLQGSMELHHDKGEVERLTAGTSVVVPAGMQYSMASASPDLEFLEITMPA